MTEYDYIVVGAGTAGYRLTACGQYKVLLVEAGGKDDCFWIDIPVGYLYTIGNTRTDWCYRTEPEAGLNGRSIGYARGKVLGGCSSINAMIYMRAARRATTTSGRNSATGAGPGMMCCRCSGGTKTTSTVPTNVTARVACEERRVNWEILDAWRDAAAAAFASPAAASRILLRVIDASVMPTITSGNTRTVMIAEQGARFVLDDARR